MVKNVAAFVPYPKGLPEAKEFWISGISREDFKSAYYGQSCGF